MPNAFAAGRTPKHSAVCVTTGIMQRLDADELEGVLAHELAHIANRDVSVMTVASSLGLLAGFITRWGMYFGGGRNRGNNGGGVPFLRGPGRQPRRLLRQLPADPGAVALPRAQR